MSTNKAILHGFVGKDPELKMTPGGVALCKFSLATTETWKNTAGEKQQKTEWHNIVAWNKQAETIEKLVKKGTELVIEGKIEYTSVEDKDRPGKKLFFTSIRMEKFDFCGKKQEGGYSAAPDPEHTGYQSTSDNNGGSDEDMDIPF